MMGLPDSRKSFNMFSRFDTILACDGHPASHFLTAKTALMHCVARVKIGRHYAVVLGLFCVYFVDNKNDAMDESPQSPQNGEDKLIVNYAKHKCCVGCKTVPIL